MKSPSRIAPLAAMALLAGLATPVGAHAEPAPSAAQALEEVAPEVLEDAVHVEESSLGDEVSEANGVDITLPISTSEPVVFADDKAELRITLPEAATGAVAVVGDGLVEYDNGDGSSTVPVPKSDGSLQIATIIESSDAPTEYMYDLAIPADYKIIPSKTGGVGIASEDRRDVLAVLATPWATDAKGVSVPTRYEVAGNVITQIVDHDPALHSYPIVADPYLGADLYGSPYLTTYQGHFRVNVSPTAWGQAWTGVATWFAHSDEVKNKLAKKYPTRAATSRWNNNVQEQLYCHIAGVPASLPEYNLEASRASKSWSFLVAYKCNYPESTWSN